MSGCLPVDQGVLCVGRQVHVYLPTNKTSALFAAPEL